MRKRFSSAHQFGLEGAEGELNLVPYLDIMVNLVMFLLFTFQVIIEMNVIAPVTPAYGVTSEGGSTEISVTLVISKEGYTLLSSDEGISRVDIPVRSGDYDDDMLRVKAAEWKDSYELGDVLTLTAARDIPYQVVVGAMDAVRTDGDRDLFPDVLLAASDSAPAGSDAPTLPSGSPT